MRDELRMLALAGVILFVMYVVGEGLIETLKAFIQAFGG